MGLQIDSPRYDGDAVNLGYLKKILDETEKETKNIIQSIPKNYGSIPSPPYMIGETMSVGNKIYKCITSRSLGVFAWSDWKLIIDGDIIEKISDNILDITDLSFPEQQDGKIETFYQKDDPALAWDTNLKKELHVNDYWREIKETGFQDYCYLRFPTNPVTYGWEKISVPQTIFDKIDGYKTIFIELPVTYKKDDYWLITKDESSLSMKKGEWYYSKKDSLAFDVEDWVLLENEISLKYIEKYYYTSEQISQTINELNRDITSEITKLKDQITLSVREISTIKETTESVLKRVSGTEETVEIINNSIITQNEQIAALSIQNGQIEAIVKESTEQIANLDEKTTFSDTKDGVDNVVLDNASEDSPLRVQIDGHTPSQEFLFPNNCVYPSVSIYLNNWEE